MKCPYFAEHNGAYYGSFCLSDKHPNYNKNNGRGSADLKCNNREKEVPKCVKEGGKGCPFFKK